MNSMVYAPKDRRILIKTTLMHFRPPTTEELQKIYPDRTIFISRKLRKLHEGWWPSGEQWVECWWNKDYQGTDDDFKPIQGRWEEWCGSYTTHSSNIIHPLGWVPLPDEN